MIGCFAFNWLTHKILVWTRGGLSNHFWKNGLILQLLVFVVQTLYFHWVLTFFSYLKLQVLHKCQTISFLLRRRFYFRQDMVPNLVNLARRIAVYAKIINLEKTANLQHSEKKICRKMLELWIQGQKGHWILKWRRSWLTWTVVQEWILSLRLKDKRLLAWASQTLTTSPRALPMCILMLGRPFTGLVVIPRRVGIEKKYIRCSNYKQLLAAK